MEKAYSAACMATAVGKTPSGWTGAQVTLPVTSHKRDVISAFHKHTRVASKITCPLTERHLALPMTSDDIL